VRQEERFEHPTAAQETVSPSHCKRLPPAPEHFL
jgi:hypothetical protein